MGEILNFNKTNWIRDANFDLKFILLPPFVAIFFVLIFSKHLIGIGEQPVWLWLCVNFTIDAAHIYSTFYRSYYNKNEMSGRQQLYYSFPIIAWIIGIVLYNINEHVFWTFALYMAVFHFVRQQYGFLRLYTISDACSRLKKMIDGLMIYTTMLYPILFWHVNNHKSIRWTGENFPHLSAEIMPFALGFYFIIAGIYLFSEIQFVRRNRNINMPKNLLILSTAFAWYLGIVQYDSAVIFSILNLIPHGVPYLALIWTYGEKKMLKSNANFVFGKIPYRFIFQAKFLPVYLGLNIFWAYIECGLWAAVLRGPGSEYFWIFTLLPEIKSPTLMSIFVPMIFVPQFTHYLLDAFIWKTRGRNTSWMNLIWNRNDSALKPMNTTVVVGASLNAAPAR